MARVRKLIIRALAVLSLALVAVGAQEQRLRDFRDIFRVARRLESAQMHDQLAKGEQRNLLNERQKLLLAFVREPKSSATSLNYQQLTKLVTDYKLKAYQYVDEIKKQKGNWFTKVITFGGPLGSMKGLSKTDPFLQSITESYETAAKTGQLSEQLVDQDLAKYAIRRLDMIMLVLATDIKYLVTENVPLLNRAIYEQLRADKFMSNNNFYDVYELSASQKKLLLEFYAARVDQQEVSIGEALEHFSEPSNLIIGRLLDSCHSVIDFRAEWSRQADTCGVDCRHGEPFEAKHSSARYDELASFCEHFLEAL